MKWKNCDIDVALRAKIPKLSKLDDIVTPLRLLKLFFDDALVYMIVGYTKLYSHREKANASPSRNQSNRRFSKFFFNRQNKSIK